MTKGFYLGLNEVLDTRASTIKCLRPDLHDDIIRNNYHNRKGDFFAGIPPEEFNAKYAAQEFDLLEDATMSNVFQFLHPQIADFMTEAIAAEIPAKDLPMLDVNIWPYELNREEIASLRSLIYIKTGGIIGVNMIDVPLAKLTPSKCSDNYHMMMMYRYDEYINMHSHALIESPVPTLLIIGPMVYFNTDPETNEETVDQIAHGINSLLILEASLAPRIGLKFVNIDIFSIVYPDERISEKDAATGEVRHSLDDLERELKRQATVDVVAGPSPSGP